MSGQSLKTFCVSHFPFRTACYLLSFWKRISFCFSFFSCSVSQSSQFIHHQVSSGCCISSLKRIITNDSLYQLLRFFVIRMNVCRQIDHEQWREFRLFKGSSTKLFSKVSSSISIIDPVPFLPFFLYEMGRCFSTHFYFGKL